MAPFELIVELALWMILPGLAASALVLAIGLVALGERARHFALALALAAGLAAANWLRQPVAYLPEETGWPAVLLVSIVALFLGAALESIVSSRRARIALALAGAIVLGGLLVPAELRGPVWLAAVILAGLVNHLILDESAGESSHGLVPLAWAVWSIGSAIVLVISHSARLAEGALLWGSALGGVTCVALAGGWLGRPFSLRAASLALGLAMPCLMLAGFDSTFSSVPWISFALVALAPLTLPLSWFSRVRSWPERRQALLQGALLAAPVAVAVALAVWAEGV